VLSPFTVFVSFFDSLGEGAGFSLLLTKKITSSTNLCMHVSEKKHALNQHACKKKHMQIMHAHVCAQHLAMCNELVMLCSYTVFCSLVCRPGDREKVNLKLLHYYRAENAPKVKDKFGSGTHLYSCIAYIVLALQNRSTRKEMRLTVQMTRNNLTCAGSTRNT
jgi:hypothetical protein